MRQKIKVINFSRLIILDSAYRHGLQEADILRAWTYFIQEFLEQDEPQKVIRIGFDTHANL